MSEERPIEDIELLLPWLHTGNLSPKERERMATIADADPELQRQLALIAEEAEAVALLNEAIPAPSRQTREALFARIEEEARQKDRSFVSAMRDWLSERLTLPSRQALAWSVGTLALVMVAQAGIITTLVFEQRSEHAYKTASHEAAPGEKLLIGFAPDAEMRQIETFLNDREASIVDGPHNGGIYSVRFGEKPLSDGEREKFIAEVKSVAIVRFVAPSR